MDYSYYERNWSVLPNFNALIPVGTGVANQVDLNGPTRSDQFGLQFTGYVNVPADGTYTFYTYSDDGSKLLIGTTEAVNNDGGHAEVEKSGTIGLKAGKHAPTTTNSNAVALVAGQKYSIRLEYYEGAVGAVARLRWTYPGQTQQVIPQQRLYPISGAAHLAAAAADEYALAPSSVYPIPARDELTVRYVARRAGTATVQLIGLTGASFLLTDYPVAEGVNLLKVPVDDLRCGFCILKTTQGEQRNTWKVLLSE